MGVQNGYTNGHSNGVKSSSEYTVTEAPMGTRRHLRIVTIGAGASGLNMARHVELHMDNIEHIVYEKNRDVGGTWFENRYPGCACDLPGSNYQFTWEPNPDWPHFYSSAPEILQYFKDVAQKYELYKYIKLSHIVVGAQWDEDHGIWNLQVKSLETGETFDDWCHMLINGSGILNNWRWPDIPGLHSFKGPLMHSAAWKDEYDLKGKTVAVLGCGSSGVQIVPNIQPDVKHLITFIRTPTWITAGFAQSHAGPGGSNFKFSEDQKRVWREDPQSYIAYCKEIESELNRRFKIILKDSPEQAEAVLFSTNEMKTKLGGHEQLIKNLIPEFAVGCRRPTPGNGYLEALTKDNVRVVTDNIKQIVPEGIELSTGELLKIDAFICATGFDISFSPRFPMTGRNGVSLAEQWKEKPEAYLSLAAANFPNYFMFLGPNAPIGHGSVIPIIEHATKYMINFMKRLQTQSIKSITPLPRAISDFNAHTTTFMSRTAWSTNCRSWFKNGKIDGPIVALHPGSRIHWFHMLRDVRYEDWEYTYWTDNRFQYLGNGFSTWEGEGMDTTFYFDQPEEGYLDY
ncbi:MAG: hypothetical protein M1827_000428 [Pycnora praestabilis]|nr:MAG: hypothetical protein M1827_000428 [Pycnora praestabilis]